MLALCESRNRLLPLLPITSPLDDTYTGHWRGLGGHSASVAGAGAQVVRGLRQLTYLCAPKA